MKKILSLTMIVALTAPMVLASSFEQAVKRDIRNSRQQTREAIKKDWDNQKQDWRNQRQENREAIRKDLEKQYNESTKESRAQRAKKLQEIDKTLYNLNKELKQVEDSKTMLETEKVLKRRSLQRRINFYERQREALD